MKYTVKYKGSITFHAKTPQDALDHLFGALDHDEPRTLTAVAEDGTEVHASLDEDNYIRRADGAAE
ncbi:hypothetical protein N9X87_00035 [bacterium]|nr:hypothetical protein [bacterium]